MTPPPIRQPAIGTVVGSHTLRASTGERGCSRDTSTLAGARTKICHPHALQ